MAPSFNGNPKVTSPPDPGSDKNLPSTGPQIPLNVIHLKQQIIEFVDGSIYRTVTGNVEYEVRQDLKTTIKGSETHIVNQNHTFTVGQDVNHTIGQNLTSTVVGTHTGTHIGPQNLTFVSPQTESREGSHQTDESESKFDNKPTHMENVYLLEFASNTGIKSEVNSGVKVELDNLFLGISSLKAEAEMGESKSAALSLKMQGLANKIMGVKAEVGGAEAKAQPEVNVFVVFIPDGILG
jgi:hypothetical protein